MARWQICKAYMMFTVIISVFFVASFLGVVAVTVDRFLAIHLHHRYQELVTHKRVVVMVISIWLLSCVFSSMISWTAYDIYFLVEFPLGIVSALVPTVVLYRTTPQGSDSGPARTTRSTDLRNDAFRSFHQVCSQCIY